MGSEGAELDVRNSERKGRRLCLVPGWRLEKGGGWLVSFHVVPAVFTRVGTENCSPKLFWLNEDGVYLSVYLSSSPQLCMWSGAGGRVEHPLSWTDPEIGEKRRKVHPWEHRAIQSNFKYVRD